MLCAIAFGRFCLIQVDTGTIPFEPILTVLRRNCWFILSNKSYVSIEIFKRFANLRFQCDLSRVKLVNVKIQLACVTFLHSPDALLYAFTMDLWTDIEDEEGLISRSKWASQMSSRALVHGLLPLHWNLRIITLPRSPMRVSDTHTHTHTLCKPVACASKIQRWTSDLGHYGQQIRPSTPVDGSPWQPRKRACVSQLSHQGAEGKILPWRLNTWWTLAKERFSSTWSHCALLRLDALPSDLLVGLKKMSSPDRIFPVQLFIALIFF
jgi:hypothetical protein